MVCPITSGDHNYYGVANITLSSVVRKCSYAYTANQKGWSALIPVTLSNAD